MSFTNYLTLGVLGGKVANNVKIVRVGIDAGDTITFSQKTDNWVLFKGLQQSTMTYKIVNSTGTKDFFVDFIGKPQSIDYVDGYIISDNAKSDLITMTLNGQSFDIFMVRWVQLGKYNNLTPATRFIFEIYMA